MHDECLKAVVYKLFGFRTFSYFLKLVRIQRALAYVAYSRQYLPY